MIFQSWSSIVRLCVKNKKEKVCLQEGITVIYQTFLKEPVSSRC